MYHNILTQYLYNTPRYNFRLLLNVFFLSYLFSYSEHPYTPWLTSYIYCICLGFQVLSKTRGVQLDSLQLDFLWKLDFELAHRQLGLPKRTCSAEPNKSWGQTMDSGSFQKLVDVIRRMWLRASLCFEVHFDEKLGCRGLRVNKDYEGNLWVTYMVHLHFNNQ